MKKNYFAALLPFLVIACSSNSIQTLTEEGKQFCYVDEIIVEEDGATSSKTITTCSDKPRVEHFVKNSGLAQECLNFDQTYRIKGRLKNVKGFLCRFEDGTWEAVDNRYSY